MKTIKRIQVAINCFCWLPLVLGFLGYYVFPIESGAENLTFWESIYAAIALYFVNPVTDMDVTNVWILAAEFLSVIVVASVLLSTVSLFMRAISKHWKRRKADSVAVYSDLSYGEKVAESCRHGFLSSISSFEEGEIENTAAHFIMFSDDRKNIEMLSKCAEKLDGKDVYVMLNEMDLSVLDKGHNNIHFFNTTDILARAYWKKYHLFDEINARGDAVYRIAITNYNKSGKAIFKYGFQNNLYSLNQKIEYHIWNVGPYDMNYLSTLKTANSDTVVVHDCLLSDEPDAIEGMDRVIVTDDEWLQIVQYIIMENTSTEIHCICEIGENFNSFFARPDVVLFGNTSELITESRIKTEETYRNAKLLNYDYSLRYKDGNSNQPPKYTESLPDNYDAEMTEEWNGLSGFHRSSNLARADYYWIEKRMKDNGVDEDIVRELEHIRWCRFYYVNRWSYGPVRDNSKRIHNLLVNYADLPQKEKEKDGFYCREIERMLGGETEKK